MMDAVVFDFVVEVGGEVVGRKVVNVSCVVFGSEVSCSVCTVVKIGVVVCGAVLVVVGVLGVVVGAAVVVVVVVVVVGVVVVAVVVVVVVVLHASDGQSQYPCRPHSGYSGL